MKKLFIILLLIISITSIVYAFIAVQDLSENKTETIIWLSEVFEKIALPYQILKISSLEPDRELIIPIIGLDKEDIADTWGEPRSGGRIHEGVDIFAERGTPVFSVAEGYVLNAGHGSLGGNYVFTIGKGGVRYYYAHLDSIAQGIEWGQKITKDSVLGYVGDTGNASGTPPHLHFGMYKNGPQDPYNLLIAR